MNMDALNGIVSALATIAVVFAIYFAPAITAYRREHPDYRAIATLNLCLGWTAIGWVIALVWAQKSFK
ncbi:superinfection immunity protein [Burkholderia ambifaria]|jgi:hypothetical protein